MEFRVLGPLEVHDNGEALALGGAKQRSLLAILLMNANEVVSTDRLIDELWGAGAPDTAGKALQGYVSQLRKALEPDRAAGAAGRVVITRSPGYLVRVDSGQLDVERFVRLAADGRAALAAGDFEIASATLREGLGLWRGAPLAEFEYAPFAQQEIARINDLRLAVVEDQIQADLELGGHAEAIGSLEKLVLENPLRERPREQLMLALYRSGRQAEALDAYRDARRTLVDELGIEPGRRLRELETAILEQDPALEAPKQARVETSAVSPAMAGGGETQFVGRKLELESLEAALEAASLGQGGLLMVGGEPGIGKSRLVAELSERARALDAVVLWGRCWEAGGAPAYWPWVQAIRAYGRSVDRSVLREQLAGAGGEVGQLLPEFQELLADPPIPDTPDSDSARFRLFEATSSFLQRAADARPLVLVLEDLHAADTPSMLLLQFLAGELPASRLLVVGTYRDIEVTPGHPLSSTLIELNRQPATRMLALGGVEAADVSRLIASIAGAEPSPMVAEAIHAGTGGNPLFIGELVRLLLADGRLAEPIDERGVRLAIPRGVRDVIGRRLEQVSEASRELLAVASVLGRDFEIEALALSASQPTEEVLALLDEAIERGLVAEEPGTRYRMRFSHVLLRDALYDGIGTGRRTQLHRRIGEALGRMYAADPEPHLAELAYHYYEAGPSGDARKAFEYARAAARRAAQQLAYEEAVRLYRLASRVKEGGAPVDEGEACDLLLELGEAHLRAGNAEDARATFLAAAEAAREIGSSTSLARAALGYGGRYAWMAAREDINMIPLLEEALGALDDGDQRLRIRVMARLSCAIRDQPFRQRRLPLSAEAVELARGVGGFELAYALDARCLAVVGPDSVEEFGATATEVVRTGRLTGATERELIGHLYLVMYEIESANSSGAREALAAARELAEATREPALRWYPTCLRAALALFEGRFDDAAELIPHAYELGREAQRFSPPVAYRLQMLALHLELGDPPYAEEPLRDLAAQYPTYGILRCGLARFMISQGRVSEARALFDELAADDFAAVYLDEEYMAATTLLTDVCRALKDQERAETLYGLLVPRGHLTAFGYPELILGSTQRPLGVLAAMTESWEEAEGHFVRAEEANAAMGAGPWVAHAQHDHGRMLAERSRRGDLTRARDLLSAAAKGYGELGMTPWQETAESERVAISG